MRYSIVANGRFDISKVKELTDSVGIEDLLTGIQFKSIVMHADLVIHEDDPHGSFDLQYVIRSENGNDWVGHVTRFQIKGHKEMIVHKDMTVRRLEMLSQIYQEVREKWVM